jgi:hypothetical protein
MRQDRFLIGLLIGIGVIIIAAVSVFLTRRGGEMRYGAEDSPEGVVKNYAIALQKEDYKRAYSYVGKGTNMPSYAVFQQAFVSGNLAISKTSLGLGETTIDGKEAIISITISRSEGPFGQIFRQKDRVSLKQDESGGWKIFYAPYPYWDWGWNNPDIKVPAM